MLKYSLESSSTPSTHVRPPRRRPPVAAATLLGMALLAGACGSDSSEQQDSASAATESETSSSTEDSEGSTEDSATSTEDSATSTEGAAEASDEHDDVSASGYPVTIKHAHGETELTSRPERIVVVGLTDQDLALAFGVVPIADRSWYGLYPNAVWPWAQDELGDATIEVMEFQLNYEQIAGFTPDLIIGTFAGIEDTEYELLAQIAPTVPQSGDFPAYGAPQEEQIRTWGLALGESERAEQLIANIEKKFVDLRAEHPEFAGRTAIWGSFLGGEDNINLYAADDSRNQLLARLGFVLPDHIQELMIDDSLLVSPERMDLLEADVILLMDYALEDVGSVRDEVLYQNLPVVIEGRDIVIVENDEIDGATSFNTPLSIERALELLVPQLVGALANLDE